MNLSHWIRAGRDEDGCMTTDEEHERSETQEEEEESHRIVSPKIKLEEKNISEFMI